MTVSVKVNTCSVTPYPGGTVARKSEPKVNEGLKRRMFDAHLGLQRAKGRKVPLEELGQLVAKEMRRREPFTPTAVSRWMNGRQEPELAVMAAIARVFNVDPGWLAFGDALDVQPDAGSQTPVDVTPKGRRKQVS